MNTLLLKQVMRNEQDFRSPHIETSGAPQVRVGIVGYAMRLVSNHTHFRAI